MLIKNPLSKCGYPISRTRLFLAMMVLFIPGIAEGDTNVDYNLLRHFGSVPASVFSTRDRSLQGRDILQHPENFEFSTEELGKAVKPERIYWLYLDMADLNLDVADHWLLRFSNYDRITLYHRAGDSIGFRNSGKLDRTRTGKPHYASFIPFTQDELVNDRYLLARIEHTSRKYLLGIPQYLHPVRSDFFREHITMDYLIDQVPYLLFIGGMLLMILYAFGIYFMNRDKLFNYYAIYLLALVLYLGIRIPVLFQTLEGYYPRLMFAYNELIQVLVNITYLIFADYFLNAKKDFPRLHKAIQYAIRLLGIIMAVQLLLILSVRYAWIEQYVVAFERWFMILFTSVSYVYILLNFKRKIIIFLLAGSLVFLFGAMAAMFLHNIKYMMVGAAVEVFIFSLAMGYRIRNVEKEKHVIEKEIISLKLTALKAQMNPHFIFNSLNSIRAYVISNETRKASDYITKFARLIRLILNFSALQRISLESELSALKLYVELEQMRYRDDYGYVVSIDPVLDVKSILVPPLLLQPYVENALIHGLAPKQGTKRLELILEKEGTRLKATIRDNGVGRSYTKGRRTISDPVHKPIAMDLTRKRIDLLESGNTGQDRILINDLNDQGQPTGTEVILFLPLQKDTANHEKFQTGSHN
jgi:sensor histidine kinase YesM